MSSECHPRSLALYEYWNRCRGAHKMPARADFDPLAVPQLMRYLSLLDVLPGEPRFRNRLVGTGIVEYFGRDPTGWPVDEAAYGPATADVVAFYSRAASGIAVRALWAGRLTSKYSGRFETICLPLGKDHVAADMLLTLTQRLGPIEAGFADTGQAPFMRPELKSAENDPFETFEAPRSMELLNKP
jgi:hypothetical protein